MHTPDCISKCTNQQLVSTRGGCSWYAYTRYEGGYYVRTLQAIQLCYRSWDKIAAKTIAASCKDFPNINRMKIDLADNPNDLYFE
ncbi:10911_t:CDS:2 [Paraglomus brasilianum]|uniref:10911_t:CDS:1 n=1 Tax=Paraglomus brasilianum TaxID=144538 RepID=A0A9N9AS47_9GLOM|nr:10911_t:CDS:2 [Paraglomus brasilianum]